MILATSSRLLAIGFWLLVTPGVLKLEGKRYWRLAASYWQKEH